MDAGVENVNEDYSPFSSRISALLFMLVHAIRPIVSSLNFATCVVFIVYLHTDREKVTSNSFCL